MPLEKQILSIPLAAKLSQATDSKLLDPAQVVTMATNVIYDKDGSITKAPGFTAEPCAGSVETAWTLTALDRLHFCQGIEGGTVLIGGVSKTVDDIIRSGDYYNLWKPTATTALGVRQWEPIGRMYPIQQDKLVAGANRSSAASVDSAYCNGNLWTAWIEDGCVKTSCLEAGTGVLLSGPNQITLSDMQANVRRVRVLAVGDRVHIYASVGGAPPVGGNIVLTTIAYNLYTGTLSSTAVASIPTESQGQFSGPAIDTVIGGAYGLDWDGNDVEVELVGDSPLAGGVTIDIALPYITIHFEAGVSTAVAVQIAITASGVLQVITPDTLGGFLTALDEQTITLHGFQDVWDAISWVDTYSILAFRNASQTANALTISSFTELGVAGPYGPTTFDQCPAWHLALAKVQYTTFLGAIAIVTQEETAAGGGLDVEIATYNVAAAFTRPYAPATLVSCGGADTARLSSCTLARDRIQEEIESEPLAMCLLEFITDLTASPFEHKVQGLIVGTNDGSVWQDLVPAWFYHRIYTRMEDYDGRPHCWLVHESDTEPVAILVNEGKEQYVGGAPCRLLDTEAIWMRLSAMPPQETYSPTLGSLLSVTDAGAEYYWPAIAIETQDTRIVRINHYNYEANDRRLVQAGNSYVAAGGQLYNVAKQGIKPHGFAYPPRILNAVATYDTDAPATGMEVNSIYKYIATYEWIDAEGELHQSAPSLPYSVRTGGEPFPGSVDGLTMNLSGTDCADFTITLGYYDEAVGPPDYMNTFDITVHIPAKDYTPEAMFPEVTGTDGQVVGFKDWYKIGFHAAICRELEAQIKDAIQTGIDYGPLPAGCLDTVVIYQYLDARDFTRDTSAVETEKQISDDQKRIFGVIDLWHAAGSIKFTMVSGRWDPETQGSRCSGLAWLQEISWGASTAYNVLGFNPVTIYANKTVEWIWTVDADDSRPLMTESYIVGADVSPQDEAPRCSVEIDAIPLFPGDIAHNQDVDLVLYRTSGNGSTYTRVGQTKALALDTIAGLPSVTTTDAVGDVIAESNAVIYSTGEPGDVLECSPSTPSGRAYVMHRNRLWIVSEEDPRIVYASKPLMSGYAAELTEFIAVRFPTQITALVPIETGLLAYAERGIWLVEGEGPDALGIGEFNTPKLISDQTGVPDASAVIKVGNDVISYSPVSGLWAINAGLALTDITTELEDYITDGVSVVTSVFRPDMQRFELYLSDGNSLWFDLRHRRWSLQGFYSGIQAACYWDKNTIHVQDPLTGSTAVCTQGGFLRGTRSYDIWLETGWIKINGFVGLQRIWWENILGDYIAPHTLRLWKYADYDTVVTGSYAWDIDASLNPYIVKHKPRIQKCSAAKYRIQVSPLNSSSGEIRLNTLELVCGSKSRKHSLKGRS